MWLDIITACDINIGMKIEMYLDKKADISTIGKRIKAARDAMSLMTGRKVSQKNLADSCEWGQTRIGNYEKDLRIPKPADIELIASVLGVDRDWLLYGDSKPKKALFSQVNDPDYQPPKESPKNVISLSDSKHNSPVFYSVNEANDKEESYEIEYYKSRGSCGGGFMNGDDEVLGTLVKEASWFTHFGVKPQNCKAIYADGDSMSDFIVDGDMVLFDISKTNPISGKIFLLRYPDGLRIKELQETVSGKWKIKSRNKAFDDEEIASSDDIEIIGQFIYRQGGI